MPIRALRDVRVERGISLEALAKKTGFNIKSLVRWETGQTIPLLSSVEKWATALSLDLEVMDA